VTPRADEEAHLAPTGTKRGVLAEGLVERGVVPSALQRRRHLPGRCHAHLPPVRVVGLFVIEPLVEERRRLAERLAAGLPERQDPDSTLLSAKAPPGYMNFTGSSIPT
jgi:hypothetical protein